MDAFKLSIGNIFKTEEEAEQALKTGWVVKLQARKRLDDYIAEKGYEVTKNKFGCYSICFNHHGDFFEADLDSSYTRSDLPEFVNLGDAEDVIANCGDDLKLLLGVE